MRPVWLAIVALAGACEPTPLPRALTASHPRGTLPGRATGEPRDVDMPAVSASTAAPPQTFETFEPAQAEELDCGARLVTVVAPRIPLVATSIGVDYPSHVSPGLGRAHALAVIEPDPYTADYLFRTGATAGVSVSWPSVRLDFTTLASNWARTMDYLAERLREKDLDRGTVAPRLEALEHYTRVVGDSGQELLDGRLFPAAGRVEGPGMRYTVDAIERLHDSVSLGRRLRIAVVGPVPQREMRAAVVKALAGIRPGTAATEITLPEPNTKPVVVDQGKKAEAEVFVGVRFDGVRSLDPRLFEILALAWQDQLHAELRLLRGHSYAQLVETTRHRETTVLTARATVAPEVAADTARAMKDKLRTTLGVARAGFAVYLSRVAWRHAEEQETPWGRAAFEVEDMFAPDAARTPLVEADLASLEERWAALRPATVLVGDAARIAPPQRP